LQKRIIYLTLLIFIFYNNLFAQSYLDKNFSLSIGDNYRIYPSNVTQTEVFIVKSPANEDVLFSSANAISFSPTFFISEGIYFTTNGGNSWQGNDTCTGEFIQYHGGDPGIVIDRNGTFIITRLGRTPFSGLYSHFSTDNGQSWSSQNSISTDDLERAILTSDAVPSSLFYGRTYAVWVKLSTPFSVALAFTDNAAQSWSTPQQINNPANRSAGGDIAVGPNGEIYICWAGVTDVSPFREILVGFAASSDGGVNWNVTENAFAVNGITGLLTNKDNIRVNGLPSIAVDTTSGARRGWMYIVTGQKDLAPAGSDPDIILNRSTDGGITWSSAIRVNQDMLNNGKTQYFPAINVDRFGAINIIFYDDRNTTNDSSGVFLARSTDGGNSWIEFEISDHNFKPTPVIAGKQGDNIDITSTSLKLWPVWMDNSTGIYQIWTVPIEFSSVNVEDINSQPLSFELKQNYPNPFNPSTTIEYSLKKLSYIKLKVYDINAREILTLVDEEQSAGNYKVNFDVKNSAKGIQISSGIYFYRIMANGIQETKTMLLLK
jgi:hypothetical protein